MRYIPSVQLSRLYIPGGKQTLDAETYAYSGGNRRRLHER